MPAISGGYVNSFEGAGGLSVSGSSVNIASGTALSVVFDGAGVDVTKAAAIGADGSWSVTVSAGELAGLDAATPDSAGETITVTATAGGVSGSQSFVYDPVLPTISIAAVEGDGYVNGVEDDSGITIAGTTVGADSGSDVDIVVSRGIQTASITDLAVSSNAWTTPFSLLNLTALGEGVISITATVDDTAGNTATATASFTYDATAPTASVTGVPTGNSNVVVLNASVGGDTVTQYKHKVVAGTACTTGGYGSEVAVATRIVDSISSLSDGSVVLCVIGRDVAGNWQSESAATSATWTKDTVAPSNSAGAMTVNGASSTLSVNTKKSLTIAGVTDTVATVAGDYVVLLNGTQEAARSSALAADSDGAVAWAISLKASALGKGTHSLTAVYYDAAGNASTGTVASAFILKVKSSSGGYFAVSGSSGGGSGSGFRAVTESVFGGNEQEQQQQQPIETPLPAQEPTPTRTHTQGERHPFILRAQQELNKTENCKVAESGIGSAGQETDYLGGLTSAALSCYQRENGFAVTGTLTPETYAHLIGAQAGTGQQQQQGTPVEGTETFGNPLGALQDRLGVLRSQLASLLTKKGEGLSSKNTGRRGRGASWYNYRNLYAW